MAVNRTYLVKMPSNASAAAYLDILVEGGGPGLVFDGAGGIVASNGTQVSLPVGGPVPVAGALGATLRAPVLNPDAFDPLLVIPPVPALPPYWAAAPAGWGFFTINFGGADQPFYSDGMFYEWRGRTLRCPTHFDPVDSTVPPNVMLGSNPPFVPRVRLGWNTTIYLASADICLTPATVQYSATLMGAVADPMVVPTSAIVIADPTYGGATTPVIRLMNSADTAGGLYFVHFSIFDPKDEDRSPTGV